MKNEIKCTKCQRCYLSPQMLKDVKCRNCSKFNCATCGVENDRCVERNSPRESKPFGKRRTIKRDLPNDKELKDVFGVVNNGCDSNQIKTFIRKTTGYEMKE